MYGRLLEFLLPYRARMGGTILCSLVAAGLEVFSFTLLVPFLQELWHQPSPVSTGVSLDWIDNAQASLIRLFLDPGDAMGSMRAVIIAILVITIVKNVFTWMAGQLGASVQEYVTRDLRDQVFRHLVRLPLSYFHATKAGQIISRILVDTEQTKVVITEVVTRSIQNIAQVIMTVVVLVHWNWRLAVLSLLIAPLLTAGLQPILSQLRKAHRRL